MKGADQQRGCQKALVRAIAVEAVLKATTEIAALVVVGMVMVTAIRVGVGGVIATGK